MVSLGRSPEKKDKIYKYIYIFICHVLHRITMLEDARTNTKDEMKIYKKKKNVLEYYYMKMCLKKNQGQQNRKVTR